MILDAVGQEVERFYTLFESANRPLWEGCMHLESSLVIRMLVIESKGNHSQSSFNQWTKLIRELSPQPNSIPKDFY